MVRRSVIKALLLKITLNLTSSMCHWYSFEWAWLNCLASHALKRLTLYHVQATHLNIYPNQCKPILESTALRYFINFVSIYSVLTIGTLDLTFFESHALNIGSTYMIETTSKSTLELKNFDCNFTNAREYTSIN